MGRHTANGQKAYKEVRKNGGSKLEAREAQDYANEDYHKKTFHRQFNNKSTLQNNASDFNNSINNGYWHTADDL